MRIFPLALFCLLPIAGADDEWTKVRELKSGSELKIWKAGAERPVSARYDDLNDRHLLVVENNSQVAIPRAEIDRIDARAAEKGGVIVPGTKVSNETNPPETSRPTGFRNFGGRRSQAMASGININSKPDYQTVYRLAAVTPPKP